MHFKVIEEGTRSFGCVFTFLYTLVDGLEYPYMLASYTLNICRGGCRCRGVVSAVSANIPMFCELHGLNPTQVVI